MTVDPPSEIDTTPFAAYVTSANSTQALKEARDSGQLSSGEAYSLHVMEAAFRGISKYVKPSRSQLESLRAYFVEWDHDAATSRANVLRMKSGGELTNFPSTLTPLGEQLAVLCRDWFPALLLHPEPGDCGLDPYEAPAWEEIVGLGEYEHPAAERFRKIFEELPVVRGKFDDGRLTWREYIDVGLYSTGSYRGLDLSSLHSSLINEAFRAAASVPGPLTPERLTTCALRSLERLEQTINGHSAEITVLHGLNGISLPDNTEVRVPWGLIRSLHAEESRLVERPDQVQKPASVVLEALATLQRVPTREFFEDPPDAGKVPVLSGLNHVERLQLAFLISSRGNGTVSPVWCLSADVENIYDPIEQDAYMHARLANPVGYTGAADLQAVVEASKLIASHHHNSMDTAARRLLRARLERSRPDDALIDAAIAIESLFAGEAHTEITFRVSTAIGWLLAPDEPEARANLSREVKSLYALRSNVVHGGTSFKTSLWERRDDAVALVVRCLEALYKNRPELAAQPDRGYRLCLGL